MKIFPTNITFLTILWYIFLIYLVAYIVFHIYIYSNNLQYEIDCKSNINCFKIKKIDSSKNTS
jgi:hypothetical protein